MLQRIFDSLGKVFANRVRLEGAFADQVDLRSTYRLLPDPMPMGDSLPMTLGHLPRDGRIRLLLEVVVHPVGRHQNHLGSHDLKIRQRIFVCAAIQLAGLVRRQLDEKRTLPWHVHSLVESSHEDAIRGRTYQVYT